MFKADLTADRVRELVRYDPESGKFFWVVDRYGGRAAKVGQEAGGFIPRGYLTLMIDGKRYYLHRLAFLLMTGSWPENEVDHINRNRVDNRWCNLRSIKREHQNLNAGRHRDGSSQFKGVFWNKKNKCWMVRIRVNGKDIHGGCFKDEVLAAHSYDRLAREHFGEFVCPNFPVVGEHSALQIGGQ